MILRVEHDGAASGALNMQRDLELLQRAEGNIDSAYFRTYTWHPYCVSLGRNQPESVLDKTMCAHHGVHVVTRPTGGRAVFHANELTYCLAIKLTSTLSAQKVYHAVHEAIFRCLHPHVRSLTFSGVPIDLRKHYASKGILGAACFTAHARSEILVGHRKLVGSAQRIINGTLLQHGSILCGPEHTMISDLLACSGAERASLKQELLSTSTSISEAMGVPCSPEDVCRWLTDVDRQVENVLFA